ncbi:MAG: DNA alkylation repair protein [Chloroflexi bacterium]|nr:DNA alkylation repair protein [Chloroflexota bacterium]
MAKRIVDYYDAAYAAELAGRLGALTGFDRDVFMRLTQARLGTETLFARLDLYAEALDASLPGDVAAHLRALAALLGPPRETEAGEYREGWRLMPIARYVERYGPADYASSVAFIYEMTQRHTGEFAIRPFLIAEPRRTMETLTCWSRDANVHVRRLASEGMRPNLPWGRRTLAALSEPAFYRGILDTLRDDPSRYVTRSVANNLNDLYRHQPSWADAIIADWLAASPSAETRWLIRHARRNQPPRLP